MAPAAGRWLAVLIPVADLTPIVTGVDADRRAA
jgi:hypothetical protein